MRSQLPPRAAGVAILEDRDLTPLPFSTPLVLHQPSPEATALEAILDASPGYLMLVDDRHRIVMVNHCLEQALQQDSIQLRGELCHQKVHGLDHSFQGCPLEAALDRGCGVERRLHDTANDQFLANWVQPTRLVTPDGAAIYLHGATDVTSATKNARELARQHRTAGALARLLVLSAWEGDLETLAQEALRVIFSLPGLDLEEKGSVFLTEQDGARLRMLASVNMPTAVTEACSQVRAGYCICGRALASGQVVHAATVDERHDVRYPGIQPHGHYCVPIRCDGQTLGVLNLYIDHGHEHNPDEESLLLAVADGLGGILRRKLAEHHLAESEARFRSLAEAAPNAILLLDEWGSILFANPKARTTFGYPAAELAALEHASLLFQERSRSEVLTIIAAPDRIARAGHHSCVGRRQDGSPVPLALSVATVDLAERAHRMLVLRDVTVEQQLQAALVRGERLASMGTLAAGIAHEINNPLASLVLNLEDISCGLSSLTEQLPSEGGQATQAARAELAGLRQTVDEMQQAIEHLEQVTTSVRSLSRVSDSRRVSVSLDAAAQQALALLRPRTMGEVQVELRLRDAPPVRGNLGQLVQVVLNLIINAMNAMEDLDPEQALVVVSCHPAGGDVVLEVRDHGPGVPEPMRTRLFEPFSTSRPEQGGTGLGLWICADIVGAHGGSIELDPSVSPGALFRVRLPAIQTNQEN